MSTSTPLHPEKECPITRRSCQLFRNKVTGMRLLLASLAVLFRGSSSHLLGLATAWPRRSSSLRDGADHFGCAAAAQLRHAPAPAIASAFEKGANGSFGFARVVRRSFLTAALLRWGLHGDLDN